MERPNSMRSSDEPLAHSDPLALHDTPADLEFPDWSGMEPSHGRVTPEAGLRLCEEYARTFAAKAPAATRRLALKCPVEFVL
jgi:hypothetical protein